jgi:hypothetical protein
MHMLCFGTHRKLKHLPRQALPITVNILDKFHQFLDMNNPCDIPFWCLFLFAFFSNVQEVEFGSGFR